jgi:hypothetical protein
MRYSEPEAHGRSRMLYTGSLQGCIVALCVGLPDDCRITRAQQRFAAPIRHVRCTQHTTRTPLDSTLMNRA